MSKFFKHETANISENANIGEGCKIWINVQIRENASVGKIVSCRKMFTSIMEYK